MSQHFLRRNRRLALSEYAGNVSFGASLTDWWPGNGNFSNLQTASNSLVNFTSVTFSSGLVGQCFNFGGSDYLYATITRIYLNFSLSMWFNTATVTGGSLFSAQTTQTTTSGIRDFPIYMQNNGKVGFGFFSGSPRLALSTNSYNDGAWHFVSVTTTESGGSQLYIDGILVASNTTTGGISNVSADSFYSRVGNGDFAGTWSIPMTSATFTGKIQDVRFYNGYVLSFYDISTLYTNGPV